MLFITRSKVIYLTKKNKYLYLSTNVRVRYKSEILNSPICWGDSFKLKCLKLFTFLFNSSFFIFLIHVLPMLLVYWCCFRWTTPVNQNFICSAIGVSVLLLMIDTVFLIIPFLTAGFISLQTYVKVSLGLFYGCVLVFYSVKYDIWYRSYFTVPIIIFTISTLTWGKSLSFFNLQWIKDAEEDNKTVENHIKNDFPLFYYQSRLEKSILLSFGAISVLSVRSFFKIMPEFVAFYIYSCCAVLFFSSIVRIFIIFFCNPPIFYNYAYTLVRPVVIAGLTIILTVL